MRESGLSELSLGKRSHFRNAKMELIVGRGIRQRREVLGGAVVGVSAASSLVFFGVRFNWTLGRRTLGIPLATHFENELKRILGKRHRRFGGLESAVSESWSASDSAASAVWAGRFRRGLRSLSVCDSSWTSSLCSVRSLGHDNFQPVWASRERSMKRRCAAM